MAFLRFQATPQFKRAAYTAGGLILADLVLLAYIVRNDEVKPLPLSDPIFSNQLYKKFNPENNTPMRDEVVKRIPLRNVKPEVLERKEHIAAKFVGGVFGRGAYGIQRWYLTRKYFGSETQNQLWDASAIKSSPHDVGTVITDHFEIAEKKFDPASKTSEIIIRCGDSPRVQEVREHDGFFVATAKVDEEKQELVLSLKSAFFQGLGKAEVGVEPMPSWIKMLHIGYALALLESGSRELTTGILA